MKNYDDLIIDVNIDEPLRSSPALGHIDKLLRQSALETQSLQVVRRMMMRDMLDRAQVTGVAKLTAAAGMRQQQRMLPDIVANGNGHHPTKKPRRKNAKRQNGPARVAALREYLEAHPGANTHEIGAALNWRPNMVVKFAREIAKKDGGQGSGKPAVWTLKSAAAAVTKKWTPREQRTRLIQAFLTKHPEAYTREIAEAVKVRPDSHFVKMLRAIAKPARPTTGTQRIQWVLQA